MAFGERDESIGELNFEKRNFYLRTRTKGKQKLYSNGGMGGGSGGGRMVLYGEQCVVTNAR